MRPWFCSPTAVASSGENEKAHAAITENVQENRRQIAALDAKIDDVKTTLGAKIDALAKDVSFIAGQAERDAR